jgi:hypothetical protein
VLSTTAIDFAALLICNERQSALFCRALSESVRTKSQTLQVIGPQQKGAALT